MGTVVSIQICPQLSSSSFKFIMKSFGFFILVLCLFSTSQSCGNVGGVGSGKCPTSCWSTCQAANFAATTTCTYTHISGVFLQTSTTTTKACNVCYPLLAG